MKKTVKTLLLALACVALLSLTALAVNFPDVPRDGSERANAIYKLADNGIVGGYEDGNFRPNNYLTRAELCKIVNLIFGYSEKDVEGFKDVKTSDWFYDYVLVAKKAGYIKGFEDNTFRGQSNLTREQTCIIISRTAGLYELPTSVAVKDKISDWAKSDVMKVIANFVMSPDANGNFRATENITRAELAMALDAFVTVKPVEPSTPSVPSGPSVPSVTYYTVKFYDGNGVVISTQTIEKGKSASAPSTTPTKAEDDEYTYTFTGWDKSFGKVNYDINVYPNFSKTDKYYTVTLDYGSGTTGQSITEIKLKYNEVIADKLPASDFANGNKYFAGWYAGNELIDSEKYSDLKPTTLTAKWVSVFTVKFYNGDNSLMETRSVKYGENAKAPTKAPSKDSDNYYTYTFKEWDKAFTNVTSNLDVYPVFEKKTVYYTVTLNYGSGTTGTKPSSVKMTYDQKFSEVLPVSNFANGSKYFAGWYVGSELIDDEKYSDLKPASLTAKWVSTFTVNFYDAKGNVLKTETVKYGESATAPANPTKASDNEYTYTFTGWDTEFTSVTANLNVKPEFTSSERLYTITLDYGTTDIGANPTQIKVTYNTLLSGALPVSNFANGSKYFAGWYVGSELIDDEKYSDLKPSKITAKWVDTFTVNFYNANGEIIKTETVKYGESATAPANPAKASDNEYTYTFTGWDTSFTNVKSNLNVKPLYNKAERLYTITLDYGNGTKKEVKMTYNQSFSSVLPGDLENDGKYFAGWYMGNTLISGQKYSDLKPTTLTAKWVDTFTVNFYNGDGSVMVTRTVKYGGKATAPSTKPTKKADNEYTYSFREWDTSYSYVTQNLDVYPLFDKKVRYYTISLDYGEDAEDILTESIKVTYNETLLDKLPTEGFKCFDMLFVGWYAGSELVDTESYADLKVTTLKAKWQKDPQVAEDNDIVRGELQTVLDEIDEPIAEGFTRTQLWVLKPVVDAIQGTINKSSGDKERISKEYVFENYSDEIALASYRMNHPYEYEYGKDGLNDAEKVKFTDEFKNDFIFALGNNLTSYTVEYLLDFFDIDKNDYIK